MLFVFIYVYWCPTWFPYQMMLVSLTVTRRVSHVKHDWTANPSGIHEFTPVFSGLRVAWSLIFCVMFCRSCFALWPLCCLSICGVWYLQTFFSGQPPFFLDNHLYFQILLFFRSFFWIYLSVISLLVECYRNQPPVASDVSGYNLRNNENYVLPRCRLRISEKILYTIHCPNLEWS